MKTHVFSKINNAIKMSVKQIHQIKQTVWRVIGVTFLAASFVQMAAAVGMVVQGPTVLYDGPSAAAKKMLILGAGHPLREISRAAGWRKVITYTNDGGWVRESQVAQKRAVVVDANLAAVRSSPSPTAAEVFQVRQGVVLEVLRETNGWLEVLHADGETGYMLLAEAWTNY